MAQWTAWYFGRHSRFSTNATSNECTLANSYFGFCHCTYVDSLLYSLSLSWYFSFVTVTFSLCFRNADVFLALPPMFSFADYSSPRTAKLSCRPWLHKDLLADFLLEQSLSMSITFPSTQKNSPKGSGTQCFLRLIHSFCVRDYCTFSRIPSRKGILNWFCPLPVQLKWKEIKTGHLTRWWGCSHGPLPSYRLAEYYRAIDTLSPRTKCTDLVDWPCNTCSSVRACFILFLRLRSLKW